MKGNPPFFPGAHRAPPWLLVRSRPLVKPRPGVRMSSLRRWRVSRQASPFLSLPLPSARVRISPVEFLHDFLFPSPKARDFVSFGLDDILHTAASDSEDFGPALVSCSQAIHAEEIKGLFYSLLLCVFGAVAPQKRAP